MSTIKTDTLSNVAGSKTVPMNTVVDGSAKAWVNFNGTGTVAIRRAFNVSSITDNGTGNYTANFTTAMVDASYVANVANPFATTAQNCASPVFAGITTSSCNITFLLSGTPTDTAYGNLSVFS